MAIMVMCIDSVDAAEKRKEFMQAHLDYIEQVLDMVHVAGPCVRDVLNNEAEEKDYNGSCFIYATDTLSEAENLFFNDPYYQSGVYESFLFSRFKPAAGEWIGGTIW